MDVQNLSISVGNNPIVRNVSFSIEAGKTLGIVGESGCGKSLTSLAIMGLLEGTQVRLTSGRVIFEGTDILKVSVSERRALLGSRMAMIFQEPMTSLNPVYRIGDQIVEMILQHEPVGRTAAMQRAADLLRRVRIPDPESRLKSFPHQLSGGMRQRVMIAIALASNPVLLIADEPTTALDVTVQAQILDLLEELKTESGMGVILISHDLGVIAQTCHSVAVMYRGQIVEACSTVELFANPLHPYTGGLIVSIPDAYSNVDELNAIPGRVPTIDERISGCAFHPRCHCAKDNCSTQAPQTIQRADHLYQCHYPLEASS